MVLRPEKEAGGRGDLREMGARFRDRRHDHRRSALPRPAQGEEVANLPIKELGDEAPEYDRPWVEPKSRAAPAADDIPQTDVADALLKLLGSPGPSQPPLGLGAV